MLISFDIFDTLIKRNVAKPTDIFLLVENYCLINKINCPEHFASKRIEAEMQANEEKSGYATIDDIYNRLGYPEVKKIEIEFEMNSCVPNKKYVDLFYRFVDAGKTVVLASDMYLPSSVIGMMLEKCGIKGYEKLYISCEQHANKSSGELYDRICEDYGIKRTQLIHYGDNKKSDWIVPRLKGIKANLVDNKKTKHYAEKFEKDTEKFAYSCISAVSSNLKPYLSDYEYMGCSMLGPLMAGFIKWLKNELLKDGISDVFFMARDGASMKQAFDLLQNEQFHTHYMYCSRRSFTVPLIWKHPELNDIIDNITIPQRISLADFINKIGLEPSEYENIANANGLELNFIFEKGTFNNDSRIKNFYEDIKQSVVDNSKNEYETLKAYIESLHFSKSIAVVDIGRHGTMQNALEQLLRSIEMDVSVTGYYVGLSPDAKLINNKLIKAKGYLHSKGQNEYILQDIAAYIPIFESLFLAQHGSVKKFELNENMVNPVLFDYEYENNDGQLFDEKSFVSQFQQGALKFVHELFRCNLLDYINLSPDVAIYNINQVGLSPSLKEASLWGDVRFVDGSINYIAKPKSVRTIRSDFMRCSWKIGFMKRLLKCRLPYRNIYFWLQKKYRK